MTKITKSFYQKLISVRVIAMQSLKVRNQSGRLRLWWNSKDCTWNKIKHARLIRHLGVIMNSYDTKISPFVTCIYSFASETIKNISSKTNGYVICLSSIITCVNAITFLRSPFLQGQKFPPHRPYIVFMNNICHFFFFFLIFNCRLEISFISQNK